MKATKEAKRWKDFGEEDIKAGGGLRFVFLKLWGK